MTVDLSTLKGRPLVSLFSPKSSDNFTEFQYLFKISLQIRMGLLRDWSLITGRGAIKREGGACEVLPLRKRVGGGGAEEVLAMLKGGHKSFGIVFMPQLEVLAILNEGGGGGAIKVSTEFFKKFYSVLRVGHKKFRTRDFPIL